MIYNFRNKPCVVLKIWKRNPNIYDLIDLKKDPSIVYDFLYENKLVRLDTESEYCSLDIKDSKIFLDEEMRECDYFEIWPKQQEEIRYVKLLYSFKESQQGSGKMYELLDINQGESYSYCAVWDGPIYEFYLIKKKENYKFLTQEEFDDFLDETQRLKID